MCIYTSQGRALWCQYLAHTTALHAPTESVLRECACPVSGNCRALARAPQELHIANDDCDNGDEDNCADDVTSSIQGNAVQRDIASADMRTSTNCALTMLGSLIHIVDAIVIAIVFDDTHDDNGAGFL